MRYLFKKITRCRISNDKHLVKVGSLGPLSLTGIFLNKKNNNINKTPLDIVFSKKSSLLQLKHNYNEAKLFGKNYGYRSGLNKSMKKHLKVKSINLSNKLKLDNDDRILDIGSNDGTFLNFFSNKLIKFGVDPTSKKFRKFYKKKINVISEFFPTKKLKKKKKFKLISCIAMFYDLRDPIKFTNQVSKYLDMNGIFHIEIAYLPDIIKKFSFDTFCQEHLTYFSYKSFKYMVEQTPFKIINFEKNNINGGSINFDLVFKNNKKNLSISKEKKIFLLEKKMKIDSPFTFKKYFTKIHSNSIKIRNMLRKIKDNKKTIYGFGASTKGNVTLQFCKINDKIMDGIYDINPQKFNKFTPGSNILIKTEKYINQDKPDYIVFLIWHFKKTIAEKFGNIKNNKTKYIWLFPKILIRNKISK